ncbi:unnamed protein product [Schistosoma margrebowiei]|uniref:Calponin-homology (CH) domain-containing protein n=1 Tax=Schistosoma margrebowiei TaxID=48269 RepID=A0AA85AMK5_9TREM|nr:unnamed protein product [Schistosoma margrebowiei]
MLETITSQSTEEAYIKWLNDHLSKATPPLIVYDLTEEIICNGVAIGILLEIIGRIKIDGLLLQPITTVERLHNIHEVFSVLRRLNVKINNIQPEDIMEGDKDTVLELLFAINDYFLPKPNMKTPKKFIANNPNHNNYDIDYKMESNGRTSAWSTISSSTRRTPINRSETVPQLNGNHENGILSTNNHHSYKNLLHHSTNGIDYPTIDLPWSNSIDHFTDNNNNNNSRQPYSSYHQSLAPTPTPSELTNSTSPRSKSTVYRVRSEPLSPRSIHSKRETSLSTAPINIRSALPNLNSGSRGYYNQTNRSQSMQSNNYPDSRNVNTIRSGRSTNELPQIVDSMNEVQQLRSQLNMLSKLIESDGSNPVRTASALRQTAAKSTQTEFGYLLDRQAKKSNAEISELRGIIKIKEEAIHLLEEENSRLSDSLKTFLYNMNKPGNLDKTTMSTNNYSIKSHEYQDLLDNNNKQRLSNNPVNTSHSHPHHHQVQQQQQQQAEHQHDYTPRHQHHSPQSRQRDHHHSNYNPSKHSFNQTYSHLNSSNTSTPINTPMIISPSHLSMIKPDIYDRTISPRSISPYKLDHSKNQLISPSSLSLSPTNSDKIKNIKRQLSPTGKRFPYYQPYIHSLMHSNELNKIDKHKCFNESKNLSHGLTTTQAQLIKSPTQRLLMQSLPSTDY